MKESNERLNTRQKHLINISAHTSKSEVANLKIALNGALDAGLTINEINEALAHLYAYVGFPPSIRGINGFSEVVKERGAKGINYEKGKEATPVTDNNTKYKRGEKAQMIVTGLTAEQLTTLFAFNPLMTCF